MILLTDHNRVNNHTEKFSSAGAMMQYIADNYFSGMTIIDADAEIYTDTAATPAKILNAINKKGHVYIRDAGVPSGLVAHKNENVAPLPKI